MSVRRVGLPRRLGEALLRYLTGWDVFISYSRADGLSYANRLSHLLIKEKAGLSVYGDWRVPTTGIVLPSALLRALRHSRRLVVVMTDEATRSDSVRAEVEAFTQVARPIIPIEVEGLSARPSWPGLAGLVWQRERASAFEKNNVEPSPEVVQRILDTIGADTQLRRTSRAAAGALAVVIVAALVSALTLVTARHAQQRRDDAIRETQRQQKLALDSESRRQSAEAQRQTAIIQRERAIAEKRSATTETERQRAIAESTSLANTSETLLRQEPGQLQHATILATEAMRRFYDLGMRSSAADLALRHGLAQLGSIERVQFQVRAGRSALSRDGRYAAAFDGAHVEVVDLTTGARRFLALKGEQKYEPLSLFFSDDESHLVAASYSSESCVSWSTVWRMQPGASAYATIRYPGRLNALAISADGKYYATCSEAGVVRVWESVTGNAASDELDETLFEFEPRCSLRFSKSGRYLAGIANLSDLFVWEWTDASSSVWNARKGTLTKDLVRFPKMAPIVTFSDDGRTLLAYRGVAYDDKPGTLTAYLLPERKELWSVTRKPDVKDVTIDGNDIAVVRKNAVEILRLESGLLVSVVDVPSVTNVVLRSGLLATLCRDGTARLYTVYPPREIAAVAHPTAGTAIALKGRSRTVISVSPSEALIWKGEGGRAAWKHDAVEAAFAPDTGLLALVESPPLGDTTIHVCKADNGETVATKRLEGGGISAFAYGPRGVIAIAIEQRHGISLWDGQSEHEPSFLHVGGLRVQAIAISPSGRYLAASMFFNVCVWDISNPSIIPICVHPPPPYRVLSLAFGTSDDELVTSYDDDRLRWWRWRGHPMIRTEVVANTRAVTRIHNGRIATAEGEYAVLRDDNGRITARIAHGDTVARIFSGENWLATSGLDGMLRVWQLNGEGLANEITQLRITEGNEIPPVLAMSPDFRYLVTGDEHTLEVQFLAPRDLLAFACKRLAPVAFGDAHYRRACERLQ
jgi:WD40 repeat protein